MDTNHLIAKPLVCPCLFSIYLLQKRHSSHSMALHLLYYTKAYHLQENPIPLKFSALQSIVSKRMRMVNILLTQFQSTENAEVLLILLLNKEFSCFMCVTVQQDNLALSIGSILMVCLIYPKQVRYLDLLHSYFHYFPA